MLCISWGCGPPNFGDVSWLSLIWQKHERTKPKRCCSEWNRKQRRNILPAPARPVLSSGEPHSCVHKLRVSQDHLMHLCVIIPLLVSLLISCSIRDVTEGPKGNALSIELYKAVRALSLDLGHDLSIPSYAWGIWPRFAREVIRAWDVIQQKKPPKSYFLIISTLIQGLFKCCWKNNTP